MFQRKEGGGGVYQHILNNEPALDYEISVKLGIESCMIFFFFGH